MVAFEIALELHDFGAIFVERSLGLREPFFELIDFDFFLGDQVHVVANLGFEILDHAAGAGELERDRDAVFNAAAEMGERCFDVAETIASKDQTE